MKDLPRNYGAFLVELGYNPQQKDDGLAAPAIIQPYKKMELSAMVETPAELAAFDEANKTLAERALPAGRTGAVHF